MLSSEDKSIDTEEVSKQVLLAKPPHCAQGMDRERIFKLIESVLSFEACFYHRILPLAMENNQLLLGMVDQKDSAALDYVNRIFSFENRLFVTQNITAESHRAILSAYLNYKNMSVQTDKQAHQSSVNVNPRHKNDFTTDNPHKAEETGENVSSTSPSLTEPVAKVASVFVNKKTITYEHLPILQISVPEYFSAVEVLPTLPPKKLLEELLAHILAGGIGRLYLERQPYHGKIFWSQNGVQQSVLEKLPLFVFQGVLNELKRFASLSMLTLTEPKQIEKECLYQQNHLLLRLRVMPGIHGEEATLQVLRGAALKFYQQQQLARLSDDTTVICQQLRYKLHELQQRFLFNRNLNSKQLKVAATLNSLLDELDIQVKILSETSDSSNQETID
ncbi:MAG: pilus assembly protein PilB [Rhizonema sp. PD37]|nr:pilus assembly protein PilB [Rhizonema sp. PD37]